MSRRHYNPFQAVDITMPVSYKDVFARYCQTGMDGARSGIDESPFPRMVDLWFLAVCWATHKGLPPAGQEQGGTYKIIDGSIFANDPWRVHVLLLLAVAQTGDASVVARPREAMSIATGLAVAGLPHVRDMLSEGRDTPIWNISDAVTDSLAAAAGGSEAG
jgi:hypothetical protein